MRKTLKNRNYILIKMVRDSSPLPPNIRPARGLPMTDFISCLRDSFSDSYIIPSLVTTFHRRWKGVVRNLKSEIQKKVECQFLGFDQGRLDGGGVLKLDFTGIDIVIVGGIKQVNNGKSGFQKYFLYF
jgi:hypothetical protein